MTGISKRDAMRLTSDIRRVHVAGYASASRSGDGHCAAMYGFVGGLEAVLRNFLLQHGCADAAEALVKAMSDAPTEVEIAAYDARMVQLRNATAGTAA